MSRLRRWFEEGLSVHVHQRGNNRADMFHDGEDRVVFLMALLESSRRYRVAIHAWVFMNNHFHLLATPEGPESIPRMMQQAGTRYVPYFNRRHARTGGLWEGRYSAHLVDTENYWFQCARYIELNPVRASMVNQSREHPWSSYHVNGHGAHDKLVTPHALYIGLGKDAAERQAAHRGMCGVCLTNVELASIRNALRTGRSGSDVCDSKTLALAG
jgi:putative transposase